MNFMRGLSVKNIMLVHDKGAEVNGYRSDMLFTCLHITCQTFFYSLSILQQEGRKLNFVTLNKCAPEFGCLML
jgi:hypothetical protein